MRRADRFSFLLAASAALALLLSASWGWSYMYRHSFSAWSTQDPQYAAQLSHSLPLLSRHDTAALRLRAALAAEQSPERLRDCYLHYLAAMPADGEMWSRLAVQLQRLSLTDELFELATKRSLSLYPYSTTVGLEQSIVAAYNWNRHPDLQSAWRQAHVSALRVPRDLARQAHHAQLTPALCEQLQHPNALSQWCQHYSARQLACARPNKPHRLRRWCSNHEFITR